MMPLTLDKVGSRRFRTVEREHVFGSRWSIFVPAGTETDFASVPRIFWPICPPLDKGDRAALAHDYLYQGGTLVVNRFDPDQERLPVDRKEADLIYRGLMEFYGVPAWRVFLYYWAVRLGGWWAWHSRRSWKPWINRIKTFLSY